MSFSSLPCFCPFHTCWSTPNLKWDFFRNIFPLVLVLFWGVYKLNLKKDECIYCWRRDSPCYSEYDFTLQSYTFIASDEMFSATHPKYKSHCRQIRLSLAMNAYCAGEKHFWCWRWTCFALEMKTLALERNMLKKHLQTSATHTHTQLATSNFQTEFMLRWLL